MNRTDALSKFRRHADAAKGMGTAALCLFGSAARNEVHASSGLDLFVDYDPAARFSLVDLVGMKQFLEERLAVAVDVTARSSLHPMLHADIEQSAVRVF